MAIACARSAMLSPKTFIRLGKLAVLPWHVFSADLSAEAKALAQTAAAVMNRYSSDQIVIGDAV